MEKIAFFHNLPIGGAKRVVYDQVVYFKKKYIVDVYEINVSREMFLNLEHLSNNFFSYPFKQNVNTNNFLRRVHKDYLNFVELEKIHKKIALDIKSRNYDFVIVHPDWLTQAPFLLKHLKSKHVYYCEELLRIVYEKKFGIRNSPTPVHFMYEWFTRKIRKKIDKENALSANRIICSSRFTAKNVLTAYGRKAETIYPGIDIDKFKPKKIEAKNDILFIGGKNSLDGYDLLISSLELFKNKPVVRVITKNNKEQNWINDKSLVNEYQKSKIVVALARDEPLGLIPLEAMSCGIPVVAINEGGYRETIINNKTGILIDRNRESLHNALSDLLKNENKRKVLGENARQYMKDSWSLDKRNLELENTILKQIRDS